MGRLTLLVLALAFATLAAPVRANDAPPKRHTQGLPGLAGVMHPDVAIPVLADDEAPSAQAAPAQWVRDRVLKMTSPQGTAGVLEGLRAFLSALTQGGPEFLRTLRPWPPSHTCACPSMLVFFIGCVQRIRACLVSSHCVCAEADEMEVTSSFSAGARPRDAERRAVQLEDAVYTHAPRVLTSTPSSPLCGGVGVVLNGTGAATYTCNGTQVGCACRWVSHRYALSVREVF